MLTLNKINQAYKRLKNVSYLTPLIYCKMLSEKYKSNIFLKAESLQISGSFKYRGAYNKILQILEKQQNQEVVAWSSGNHAYAVAMAANKLGIKATDWPHAQLLEMLLKINFMIFYSYLKNLHLLK